MLSSARSCRSSICPDRLSTAWLVSRVVFSCHMVSKCMVSGDTRGPSVIFHAVYMPCSGRFHFLTWLIISMNFVLSLTQMFVFLSLYVMLSILLSILVCAAASLFCDCLVSVLLVLFLEAVALSQLYVAVNITPCFADLDPKMYH